jgi:N-acylglucosamine 2-epimerase
VDENNVLHEILTCDNRFFPQVLCQHMNPGHTIEDIWFMLDAADLCGRKDWEEKIFAVARKALENGWDTQYGGILHFSGVSGGKPEGDTDGVAEEPMTRQLSGWDDKLWWIHSEALYTTLLCHFRTGDDTFLDWHDKVFDYTYRTFPNPDPEIREWIQIRRWDGSPQEKVVALTVKDPFHIARNLILILELLQREKERCR